MKTYLVTGAAGFIGSHLAENLLKSGNRVINIDNFNDFYDKNIKIKNVLSSVNKNEFEVIAEVYSDPYAQIEDDSIELPIPELMNEKGEIIPFRTYIYTYNVDAKKVIKTELIK